MDPPLFRQSRIGTTDALNHTIAYAYDALNRLMSSTDPLNRTMTYAYDAAGHPVTLTDQAGHTTTNTYDAAGNRTGTSYSDGTTPNVSFTYTATGQRATMSDGTGTTTNAYDSLGRLTGITNGSAQATSYTYDLAGHLTALAYPNGQSVARSYDNAGRLTGITDWAGHTTTFTPDPDSNTTSTVYGDGVTASATFDAAGRISAITDTGPGNTALASFSYTRNNIGSLASATTTGISQPAETYSYTSRDQLATVNTGAYGYDPGGNATALANGAALTYDAANQPTSYTISGTTTAITYDTQGNRLTGPAPGGTTASYTWDQANRLTAANGTSYAYNADSLRTTRTPATGPVQHFAWDTRAGVPLMLTDGTTSYIYDDRGNAVEQIDSSGNTLYYQHDQYGSTRILTDQTGSAAASYTYDAYGNLTNKTGAADTVLRWNGQTQDVDTGLYYLRGRYYDPQTAQFINADPLAAVTKAIYSYANSDPLNKMDPLGLSATPISEDNGGTGCASSNSYNSYISGPSSLSSTTGCVTSFDSCTDQQFAQQGGGKSWEEIQRQFDHVSTDLAVFSVGTAFIPGAQPLSIVAAETSMGYGSAATGIACRRGASRDCVTGGAMLAVGATSFGFGYAVEKAALSVGVSTLPADLLVSGWGILNW